MRNTRLKVIFVMLAFSKVLGASGSNYPLQYQVEKCLEQKIGDEFQVEEGQVIDIRFFPAQLGNHVTATVLAEVLLTYVYTSDSFILAVGGGIDPTDFAKGLNTVFDRNDDAEFKKRLKTVTIVYYSHYPITTPLYEVTEKYGMTLILRSMDARTQASLIGSGC